MNENWYERHEDELKPKYSFDGIEKESLVEYCCRIQIILPNFPDEVLKQWFYQHGSQIGDYSWLDYPTLKFTQQAWNTSDLVHSEIGDNRSVQINRENFMDPHIRWTVRDLESFFKDKGTWPVAPILFRNDKKICFPRYNKILPYYIVEGHKRLALFLSLYHKSYFSDIHQVWITKSKKL